MEKIILSIMAIIGISISIAKSRIFSKIISFGLAFSILITWFCGKYVIMASLLLLIIASLLTFIYGIKTKKISKIERFSICVTGLLFAITLFSKIMYLPEANLMKIILVFPLISYTIGLVINKKIITCETGFMIVWMTLLITEIICYGGNCNCY